MEPGLGLTYRKHHQYIQIFRTTLIFRVKIAHGIQLVTKKFCSHRPISGRGVNIQNAATDSELAGAFHHGSAAVACMDQPGDQFFQRIFRAGLQREGGLLQHSGRHGAHTQGFPGQNLQHGLSLGKIIQLPQAFLLPGTADYGTVVKGQFTAGQDGGGFS